MMTYLIQAKDQQFVKIGKTKDIHKRLQALKTGSPYELIVLQIIRGDFEEEIHARFNDYRIRKNSEWFVLTDEIVMFFKDKDQQIAALTNLAEWINLKDLNLTDRHISSIKRDILKGRLKEGVDILRTGNGGILIKCEKTGSR